MFTHHQHSEATPLKDHSTSKYDNFENSNILTKYSSEIGLYLCKCVNIISNSNCILLSTSKFTLFISHFSTSVPHGVIVINLALHSNELFFVSQIHILKSVWYSQQIFITSSIPWAIRAMSLSQYGPFNK